MDSKILRSFRYRFDAGPQARDEMDTPIAFGNCRLAVQDFFYRVESRFFEPERVLCPEAYRHTGMFIMSDVSDVSDFSEDSFSRARRGDVVFAERIKNARGEPVDSSIGAYQSEEEYIIRLHMAVWIGKIDEFARAFLPIEFREGLDPDASYLWHSSAAGDGTCLWSLSKFLEYYRAIAIKRW